MNREQLDELVDEIYKGVRYVLENMIDEIHDRGDMTEAFSCLSARRELITTILESLTPSNVHKVIYEDLFSYGETYEEATPERKAVVVEFLN